MFYQLSQAGLAQLIQVGQTLAAWSEEIVEVDPIVWTKIRQSLDGAAG
jgi:hypothetical protein